ncbi:MAG: 3-dehydroquinate synthase [Deltaproteobacteria bacterium]|nr:3-dehydroquinate synthase [Deltaproteobacteria bacterium]
MTPDILTVALGERTYDIFFGENIYPFFQEWICRFYPEGQVFVVTDRNVASIYGEDIRLWLAGIPHHIHVIAPGEETKNWQTVLGIYAFLARGNAGRDALVVAFGGGVVGDLAGFAAATFLRGIPCVQIPTTLLSQVDSSVGGKTGFNLPEGKNLVGAFHQPRAVFIDNTFLRTLDDRELRAGMGEVVKCALAGDAVLWETLCSLGGRWRSMSAREWQDVIRRSVAFKASIVAEDERESSVRRILNLGHTVGHAMEQAAGYGNLLHGEAVAMGIAWEAALSRRMGVTPPEVEDRLCSLLKEIGFALDDPGIALAAIASAIGADKKRLASDVDLPMVTAPGVCALKRVPLSFVRKELPALREEIRRRGRGTAVDAAEERTLRAKIEEGDLEGATASLERRVESNPRDLRAMVLLSEAYLFSGKYAAAWEMIKEVLQQYPAEARAQRLAREIEGKLHGALPAEGDAPSAPLEDVILLEEGAFEIRSADLPQAVPESPAPAAPEAEKKGKEPAVLTITMADVCWDQGEREIARRIVDEILRRDPGDLRALEWKKTREERTAEMALAFFLGTIAKEYGYELSGPH